jgi:hypothetical protein
LGDGYWVLDEIVILIPKVNQMATMVLGLKSRIRASGTQIPDDLGINAITNVRPGQEYPGRSTLPVI